MRRAYRLQIVMFLAASLSLIVLLAFWSRRPTIPRHEVPEQRLRINDSIAELAKETWEQSVENVLTNGNQFNAGMFGIGVVSQQLELEQMLGARRAIKILNSLERLPKDKRVQECRALFNRVLRAHEKMILATIESEEKHSGLYYYWPKSALCLAMFATAQTGRRDILAEQFASLDELQKRIERRTSQRGNLESGSPPVDKFQQELWFYGCIPEPRFLINVLRVAVSCDPEAGDLLKEIDAYCQSRNLTSREVLIVPWNARTTSFERLVGSGVDTSKGSTRYLFYDWKTQMPMSPFPYTRDASQLEIVRTLRELALEQPVSSLR